MKNIIDGTYFYFELVFIQFVLHDVFLVSIYLLQDLFALIAPVVVEIGSREQPTLQTDIPIPIPTLFLTFNSEIKFLEVPTHGGNLVCRKIGCDGYKKKLNFILVLKVISSATKCF